MYGNKTMECFEKGGLLLLLADDQGEGGAEGGGGGESERETMQDIRNPPKEVAIVDTHIHVPRQIQMLLFL